MTLVFRSRGGCSHCRREYKGYDLIMARRQIMVLGVVCEEMLKVEWMGQIKVEQSPLIGGNIF